MFHVASFTEVKKGETADIYFQRTVEILKRSNIEKKVTAEIRASSLPNGWKWAVLAGIEEVAYLLEGFKVSVKALPEGTIFKAEDPVLQISGNYIDFGALETAILGLLCQASGIATVASRLRIAAGDRTILSFGARRMHPVLSPMIDRQAYIGGCDGVAVVKSGHLLGIEPKGTMPHALILIVGDPVEAFRLFHQIEPKDIPRIALIDTFGDEKFEAINAAEALGKDLFAVRLDTPSSRKGDFRRILEEVRWELDIRGFQHVRLFVSGGLNEEKILELNPFADAYGVGTYLSNAKVIDFSMDIVEIEGRPIAKRGKKSGSKDIVRCDRCFHTVVLPKDKGLSECTCGGRFNSLFIKLIEDGKINITLPSPQEIRRYVLQEIREMKLSL